MTKESAPQHAEAATAPYVNMEDDRIVEEGTSTTLPARNDNDNCVPGSDNTFKDEVVELFWELMDFNRQRNWKKKVLTVFMVASSMYVIVDLLFLGHILHFIHIFAEWMSLHILPGTLVFVLLLIVCTLVMIPPSILIFVCGYVYAQVSGLANGIPAAIVASFVGCAVGAIIAFLRARYMMRDLVGLFSKRYKIIRAADRAIAHHGLRVMLLLRLCVIVPFNALNYIGGVTAVTMEDFILSLVGMLPLIILTVVAGATAESLMQKPTDDMSVEEYAVRRLQIVAGLIFVFMAVCITLYKAKKELVRELEAENQAEMEEAYVSNSSEAPSAPSITGNIRRDNDDFEDQQIEVFFAPDEEWFWLYT